MSKEFSKLMDALEAWVATARGSREEILSGADLASAYMEYRDAPKPLMLEERITELEEECDALLRGEYICSRCGIRKNAETVEADF